MAIATLWSHNYCHTHRRSHRHRHSHSRSRGHGHSHMWIDGWRHRRTDGRIHGRTDGSDGRMEHRPAWTAWFVFHSLVAVFVSPAGQLRTVNVRAESAHPRTLWGKTSGGPPSCPRFGIESKPNHPGSDSKANNHYERRLFRPGPRGVLPRV